MLAEGKSSFLCVNENKGIFILKEGVLHAGPKLWKESVGFLSLTLVCLFQFLIRDSWKSCIDSLPFQLLVVLDDDNRLGFLNSFFFAWYAFSC